MEAAGKDLKYVVDIWLHQSIMNTVSLVNFISFHYWLSSVSSYFNLELFFMLSSPHLCNLSTEYYTKESHYFENKHITAHYSMENALYSLVCFLILLNLWIKTLRSHIPWSTISKSQVIVNEIHVVHLFGIAQRLSY